MKFKTILKRLIRKSAYFFNSSTKMTNEEAISILNAVHKDPSTTCVGNNTISIQYDLQIIVPAYNVSKYVGQCLESILNQETKYSYLVTVVNDGSTDNSLDIIRSYEQKYPNKMEVINQKNRGFSGARNTAMKTLKGKYVTFLDSDDVLVEDAIDVLMDATKDEDKAIDIVQGSWYRDFELNVGGELSNIVEAKELSGYPWGKVFKAKILEHFQFPEGYWFEDTPVSFILYGKDYSYKCISNVVYGYRLNPNGITATSVGKVKSIDSFYITELCLKEFPIFDVSYNQRAYEYFLEQCVTNYWRTVKLSKNIRKAIFVLESTLMENYFKHFSSETNKDIEEVLQKKQFLKFEILLKTR